MASERLNNRFVESVRCPADRRQEDYRDIHPDGRGLALRVSANGLKTWNFIYTADGKKRRYRLGTFPAIGLKSAREQVRALRAQLDGGDAPHVDRQIEPAPLQTPTMADAVEAYADDMRRRDRKESSIQDLRDVCRLHVLPALGDRPVDGVTAEHVRSVLAPLAEKRQAHAHNKVLTHIRTLCRFVGVTPDPTARIAKLTTRHKDFTYSDAELTAVWRALDLPEAGISQTTALAIRLAAATMKRGNEVAGLNLSEIDFDQAIWTIPRARTKGRRPDAVPLSSFAVELIEWAMSPDLRPMGPETASFVFAARSSSGAGHIQRNAMSRAMARAVKLAGVKDEQASLHSLRDTGATWVAKRGYPVHVISALLGHAPAAAAASPITAKYQHYDFVRERREALEAWGEHLRNLTMRA